MLLGLTAAASAGEADVKEEIFWSGSILLMISIKEIEDIIKKDKSLKNMVCWQEALAK